MTVGRKNQLGEENNLVIVMAISVNHHFDQHPRIGLGNLDV